MVSEKGLKKEIFVEQRRQILNGKGTADGRRKGPEERNTDLDSREKPLGIFFHMEEFFSLSVFPFFRAAL